MLTVIHFTLSRDSTDQFVLPSLLSKTRFIFALSSASRCTSFVSGTLSWGIIPFFLPYAFSLPHLHKIPANRIDELMLKILLQRRFSGLVISSCTVWNDFKKLEDCKTIFLTNGWNADVQSNAKNENYCIFKKPVEGILCRIKFGGTLDEWNLWFEKAIAPWDIISDVLKSFTLIKPESLLQWLQNQKSLGTILGWEWIKGVGYCENLNFVCRHQIPCFHIWHLDIFWKAFNLYDRIF